MAGRVERRINDRFYFVVDEVGCSSGNESGTVSEDEVMSSANEVNGNVRKPGSDIADAERLPSNVLLTEGKLTNRDISEVKYVTDKVADTGSDSRQVESDAVCNSKTVPNTELNDEGSASSQDHNTDPTNMDIDNDLDEVKNVTEKAIAIASIAPAIKISFRDEKIEKTYKSSLLKFLSQKIHPSTVAVNSENSLELEIYEGEIEKLVDNDVLDFHLDTTPCIDSRSNRVPAYGKNHDILLGDTIKLQTTSSNSEPPSHICFNCCGNHILRDCPHARNVKEINRNRAKFQSTNKLQRNSRYHLDENQRFSNFIPGELSKKLRAALDLRKDQQPLFIYRMRLLGYPPAWLEEARVSHSGVAVYDSKGVPLLEEDEEEGEIIAEGAKDRFDISKIIEFPGFNVPLPKYMKEEGKFHCCPAISEEQSKENLIKTLEPNAVQAYKKRSLTLQKSSSQEELDVQNNKRLPSPTIEEMEEKKRQLLTALIDEESTSDHKLMQSDNSSSSQEVSYTDTKSETPAKDVRFAKNTDFGTPVFKSISPYSKLPSREQFSVNVSDVINFENLPNSTGKYETMSNLILKIRDTVSKMQNE